MPIYDDLEFGQYVRNLPAASEADLSGGNNMPLVRSGDVKKLPADKVNNLNTCWILPSHDGDYPKFDFDKNTFTIHSDSVVVLPRKNGTAISLGNDDIVVSFANDIVSSSAIKIVYSVSTNTLYAKNWDSAIDDNDEFILATVRKNRKTVNMIGPFYVGDNLFGLPIDMITGSISNFSFYEDDGFLNVNGNVQPAADFEKERTTKLFPVQATPYQIRLQYPIVYNMWIAVGEYDVNKRFIRRVILVTNSNRLSFRTTYTPTDENVKYLRFSYRSYGTCLEIYANVNESIFSLVGEVQENNENKLTYGFLLPGVGAGGTEYPRFDFVNNTVTIPADTLIMLPKPRGTWKQLSAQEVVVSFRNSTVTSSAVKLVYSVSSNVIRAINYNAQINTDDDLLLATIRINRKAVNMIGPFYVDGVLFGKQNASENIFTGNVKGINHRGFNTIAPENTLSAYKLSRKNNFEYVETDVSFTSDGVPVLLHDNTIDRTSNGSGNISELTFEQVRQYDFGSWKSAVYAGEKIPSFEEFIRLCKSLGLKAYVELKSGASYTELDIRKCCDIVRRYGMDDNVSWISFNAAYLGYVKSYSSSARLGFVVGIPTDDNVTTAISLKSNDNNVFIDASNVPPSTIISRMMQNSIALELWGNVSSSNVSSLEPYVSGITHDSINAPYELYLQNK